MKTSHSMRRSVFGRILIRTYPRLPFRSRFLQWLVKREGGEMFSLTLRDILYEFYGVRVGKFSYGSLLSPGYADQQTTIGNYVSIGPNVRRFGAAHPMSDAALHPLFYNPALGLVEKSGDVIRSSCVIGDDAWIGANVSILPGCSGIGKGAVIGAGSVVTKDVPAFAVVAGNPAKKIGDRLSQDLQIAVSDSSFWSLDPKEALEVVTGLNSRKSAT